MFEDYKVRLKYHCVAKRVKEYDNPRLRTGKSWNQIEDNNSIPAMCIQEKMFKDDKYKQPWQLFHSFEDPTIKEYEFKLNDNFKFVVREIFDRWDSHYFYETFLILEYKKEDQTFESFLYNVTVLNEKVTENGYSDSPILNEQLTLENLLELYQHCFKKNVHELCFSVFPKIMNDCFDAGKDQIKEQTQNFFSNVLGIRGGGW